MRSSRIRTMLVAMLAVFALSAVASASASAEGPHWFVKGIELKAGESAKVVSKSTTSFALKGTIAGVKITITCTTETDKATLEGGGPGKDKDESKFTVCSVTAPAESGCKVTEPITVKATTLLVFLIREKSGAKWKKATEAEYNATAAENRAIGDEFKPETGTTFASITLSGCNKTHEALDGTFAVEGTDTGIANGSLLEFSAETSNLTFATNEATLTGKTTSEVEGGGTVEAKK